LKPTQTLADVAEHENKNKLHEPGVIVIAIVIVVPDAINNLSLASFISFILIF